MSLALPKPLFRMPLKAKPRLAHEIERRGRRWMNGESVGEAWEDGRARVVER